MFIRFLLFLTAAALFTGCLPESKNPIAPAVQTFNDRRLEGVWEHTDDDGGRTFYHMRWRSDGRAQWVDVVGVAHRKEKGLDAGGYRAWPARIGADTFLSFKEVALSDREQEGANYSFARYDFNWRGDLRIRLASASALAAAVKSGALRGKVRQSQWTTEVLITDSSAKIAGYVGGTNADKVFDGEPMVLRKVRGR